MKDNSYYTLQQSLSFCYVSHDDFFVKKASAGYMVNVPKNTKMK